MDMDNSFHVTSDEGKTNALSDPHYHARNIQKQIIITHQRLLDEHLANCPNATEQRKRNIKSVYKKFIEFCGHSWSEDAASIFDDKLPYNINKFLKKSSIGRQTAQDRKSIIYQLNQSCKRVLSASGLPGNFSERLVFLQAQSGLTISQIAKRLGVSRNRIYCWSKGHKPAPQSCEAIRKMEALFDVPRGTLMNFLTTTIGPREKRTEYQLRLKIMQNDQYALKEFPPRLEQEFKSLVEFKTSDLCRRGEKRTTVWRKIECRYISDKKKAEKTGDGFYSTSAYKCRSMLIYFFGFLKKVHPELSYDKYSLMLFCENEFLRKFVEWRKLRSGGYNNEILNVLACAKSLLREKTGFLRQHPEFFVGSVGQKSDWDEWCDRNWLEINEMVAQIKPMIKATRPAFRGIEPILTLQEPCQILYLLEKRLIEHYDTIPSTYRPSAKAAAFRNYLLIAMMHSNPLRQKHFQLMSYKKDNSGNLYQNNKEEWRIRFEENFFKNPKKGTGFSSGVYDVPVEKRLWTDIEKYLVEHRKFLKNQCDSDYFFLTSPVAAHKKNSKTSLDVAAVVHWVGDRFLGDEWLNGRLSPHDLRHIVATDLIKNNIGGWELAAAALHDTVDMVRKTYAHIQAADVHQAYLDERARRYKNMQVGGLNL